MHIEKVTIGADSAVLDGVLWLPEDHIGVILFASCGGSNRVQPPNDYVASVLRSARLGTLWMELLTAQEKNRRDTADVGMLAARMSTACDWLRQHQDTRGSPIGLFGASYAAAAAMLLASEQGSRIAAVVSRAGRTDLMEPEILTRISAPTLLIAGSLDEGGIAVNRTAYAALRCKKRFEIIPGGTNSFEEPGSMEVVARLTRSWFLRHSSTAERHI